MRLLSFLMDLDWYLGNLIFFLNSIITFGLLLDKTINTSVCQPTNTN